MPRSRSSRSNTNRGALALPRQLGKLLEGFQLILRSPYLLLLCSNLLLTYVSGLPGWGGGDACCVFAGTHTPPADAS